MSVQICYLDFNTLFLKTSECSDPDITDKTFDVNFIDSSRIDPKKYAK